jgi:hypothetical protein
VQRRKISFVKRRGMTHETQVELAKQKASFLVEQYLVNPGRRQVVTVELLRELLVLAKERFGAYAVLDRTIQEASPLLWTVTVLRRLPPHEPPVVQPAMRLVRKSNADTLAQRIVDNLNKNVREGRESKF